MNKLKKFLAPLAAVCMLVLAYFNMPGGEASSGEVPAGAASLEEVPPYAGSPYVVLNDNRPDFDSKDLTTVSFEDYSELDELGRCGRAYASLSTDTMPTQERGSISQVKPTGWQAVKYDCVDGRYLFNRCHLIGYQLSAEDANWQNLITGTRYMNVQGMLPFENMVADYIKETGNHVLYRVTPCFQGDNLVASGVQMEAFSVEDEGKGICFNVYCYNVQPQIVIDYATGDSRLADPEPGEEDSRQSYILNTKSYKFHDASCASVADIQEENRQEYRGSREGLLSQGYEPCGRCKP